MIFNTPLFYFFFLIFIFFYGFVFLRHRPKIYFIIVASLVFYGAWNYRFIPLLVGSAVADYFIAQAIGSAASQRAKRIWVSASIALNLGILGLFKYADFVLSSVADFMQLFGYQASMPALEWVLPVGISFYTFQSLSYTIDVYRGDMAARKGLAEFTAALSFFPQLVAGPILRARQILPQMHNIPTPTWVSDHQSFRRRPETAGSAKYHRGRRRRRRTAAGTGGGVEQALRGRLSRLQQRELALWLAGRGYHT